MCASFQKEYTLTFVVIDLVNDVGDSFDSSLRGHQEGSDIPQGGSEGRNFFAVSYDGGGSGEALCGAHHRC